MKNSIKILSVLIVGLLLIVIQPSNAEDQNESWSSSYDSYRSNFKSLSPMEKVYCETLLREILNALDTKTLCNGDDDCTLIKQEPFGDAVPIPLSLSKQMKTKMEHYCERCDNGSSHIVRNKNLIHRPVCHNGKCMVSTRLK